MSDEDIKRIPIKELRQEEGASELASSPDMEPYLRLIMAEMQGVDVQPHLEPSRSCRWKNAMSGV